MFLLALVIAGLIVVWAAYPPLIPWSAFWEKPEFWQTWLPTWLQGLGTVGAVYVGWRALSVWRDQYSGQRRAETAEGVIGTAGRLVDAMVRLRIPNDVWRGAPPEVLMKLANVEPAHRDKLLRAVQKLEEMISRAEHHGLPTDALNGAYELTFLAWRMQTAQRFVSAALENEIDYDDEAAAQARDRYLRVLVRNYDCEGEYNAMAGVDDKFAKRMKSQLARVENGLVPVVRGKK